MDPEFHLEVLGNSLWGSKASSTMISNTSSRTVNLLLFGLINGLGDSPLKLIYPKLFDIAVIKEASITEVWNEVTASWVLNFRRHLKDEEISEWASLRHCIPNVRLTQHVDPWIWKLESSGLFSSKSLYTKLISIHTSIAQNFYTKIWNCLAQRELNFSFGKLSIHVSTQPTDSKNAALGFVYLLRGGVCAKMMSDHDWRGLLWKLSSRAIHLGHSPHRAGSGQVAHGLCRKSQLSPERSSLGFQQFYQPKDYHLGRMQPVNTFSNSDKLSEGTSP